MVGPTVSILSISGTENYKIEDFSITTLSPVNMLYFNLLFTLKPSGKITSDLNMVDTWAYLGK